MHVEHVPEECGSHHPLDPFYTCSLTKGHSGSHECVTEIYEWDGE
jgi:hypothetical protein